MTSIFTFEITDYDPTGLVTAPATSVVTISTAGRIWSDVSANLVQASTVSATNYVGLPPGGSGGGWSGITAVLSSDTGRVNLTLGDSQLSFPVTSGTLYRFKSYLVFKTAATTTGLRFGLTCPAFTTLAATGKVPVAAGGTGGVYHSYITASGVSVTGTGVALAGVNYLAELEGVIRPSAGGSLVFQFATEVNASRVTLTADSFAVLDTIQ